MLRVEPTEEKMITRSRVKTLLRGGQLSDEALQDLARTFTDRTTAENNNCGGYYFINNYFSTGYYI